MTTDAADGVRSLSWVKASSSYGSGNCVEVASVADGVLLRDSKNPAGPWLSYTGTEFRAFVTAARQGEFDHLV